MGRGCVLIDATCLSKHIKRESEPRAALNGPDGAWGKKGKTRQVFLSDRTRAGGDDDDDDDGGSDSCVMTMMMVLNRKRSWVILGDGGPGTCLGCLLEDVPGMSHQEGRP